MAQPLRVLIVEDNPDDAQMLLHELSAAGYDVQHERVDTAAGLQMALAKKTWDVVLSDATMPQFSGQKALALVKESRLDLPFIVVSGTIGEDVAVEAMRAGAHDYFMKGRLTRLAPAIERELREAALRAERKKLQEQLVLSDRIASLGILAAGVAHEINSPLAAIIANVDYFLMELQQVVETTRNDSSKKAILLPLTEQVERFVEPLRQTQECAERIRRIVQDIRTFARPTEELWGSFDVRRVIDSSIRLVWNEVRYRARLVKDYGDVPLVRGNESRLGQVFLNLILNAAQAIPEGNYDSNEIRIKAYCHDESSDVVVEVSDSGCGISEDILPHIFEPLFTTKPVGMGTGLGLFICYRIIQDAGGSIVASSIQGRGTTFRITLPRARVTDMVVPALSEQMLAAPERGKVLVVDEDSMLCAAIERTLSNEHDITVLHSAKAVLASLELGQRYDAIVCSLNLPDMNGIDLYRVLGKKFVDQAERMIFTTSNPLNPQGRAFLQQVTNIHLEKPIDLHSLRRLLAKLV